MLFHVQTELMLFILRMMVLGLKPGDEVITTNFTFIATVEVVALLGLKLVIVDPDPVQFQHLC